jgi:hypothetical protein
VNAVLHFQGRYAHEQALYADISVSAAPIPFYLIVVQPMFDNSFSMESVRTIWSVSQVNTLLFSHMCQARSYSATP